MDIVACGAGGLLIQTSALLSMPYGHWFDRFGAGEDMSFCRRAVALGVPLYLDLGARMGHISNYSVWPMRDKDGHWTAGIGITKDAMLAVELG